MARGTCFRGGSSGRSPSRAVGPAKIGLGIALAFWSATLAAESWPYDVDPESSHIDVKVGTAGLLRFAGHDHGVRVKVANGEIIGDPRDVSVASVSLAFSMADVRVLTTEGRSRDIPKIQEKMLSAAVLDVSRFPDARFRSTRVEGRSLGTERFELQVTGDLTLHGTTRPISARLLVVVEGRRLVARGRATIKQTDFGIEPVSVAGVVKVKNDLRLDMEIVALARRPD
jgi:polyisoprenoid-binding protein YceI